MSISAIYPVDIGQIKERYRDEKFELDLWQYVMILNGLYALRQEIEKLQTEVDILRYSSQP